jgi:hypothetical protein
VIVRRHLAANEAKFEDRWRQYGHADSHRTLHRSPWRDSLMNLKLVMAVSLSLCAIPAVVYAQQNGPATKAPKPAMADVQKLVQTINSDKAKVQAYCEMGKVLGQMDQAEQKKDTRATKALSAKADSLAQQLGPDYTRVMNGLEDLDPNSAEGRRLTTAFEPLFKQCK